MSAIYLVKVGDTKKLVRASSRAVAVNHVVKETVEVKALTADELLAFVERGVKVEDTVKKTEPKQETKDEPKSTQEPETEKPDPNSEGKTGLDEWDDVLVDNESKE